jgi:hypothetical protein
MAPIAPDIASFSIAFETKQDNNVAELFAWDFLHQESSALSW